MERDNLPTAHDNRLSTPALSIAIGVFAYGVALAVAAHVVAGTDWASIRAECDRFVAAFWRAPANVGVSAEQVAAARAETTNAGPGDRNGGTSRTLQLPGLTIGDIKLPDVTLGTIRPAVPGEAPSSAPTRSYTIFDVVVADGLRIVTGHEYGAGSSVAQYAFCYGHLADSADGIEPHVTLARRKPGEPPDYPRITPKQADALGRPAAAAEAAARAHCKL